MGIGMKKIVYIALGFLFLGLGSIGVVLPVLPTTPFFLLASFFFAKGSEKFNKWFTSTKLYKKHLQSFITHRAMERNTKIKIIVSASTMLILAAIVVDNLYFSTFIALLMLYKYYYFIFKIKTVTVQTIDITKDM